MKKTLVITSMLAAFCAACDDDDNIKKSTDWTAPECSSDARVCENGNLKICSSGRWIIHECASGACVVDHCVISQCDSAKDLPDEASVEEKLANGISADRPAIKSCEDGKWVVNVCDRNQTVKKSNGIASCADSSLACKKDEKRCGSDGQPQSCNDKGEWIASSLKCKDNERCLAGDCVAVKECVDGLFECDSEDPSKFKTCVDGRWDVKACDENKYCNGFAKECIENENVSLIGKSCNDDEFKEVCENHEWYYCQKGTVTRVECANERACVNVTAEDGLGDYPDGGQTCLYTNEAVGNVCKAEGDVSMDVFNTCVYGAQYGIIMYAKCVKASETDAADGAAEGLYVSGEIAGAVCDGKDAKYSCSGNSVVRSACDGDCENIPGTYDDSAKTNEEYYGSAQCTVASASAEIGAACNVKEFESYCQSSSVAVSCPGGSIYARQCPDGSVCKAGLCVPSNTCWGVGCSGYGGNGGNGGNGGSSDDTLYDCSNETYEGHTLSEICESQNPGSGVALCVPCDEEALFCTTSAQASQLIGQSANEMGANVCGGSGSGGSGSGATCDVYDCSSVASYYDDCSGDGYALAICSATGYTCATRKASLDSSCDSGVGYTVWTQSGDVDECLVIGEDASCLGGGSGGSGDYEVCDADCSTMPGSTAICHGNYYQCSKPCTSVGSTSTLCDDMSGSGDWASYPVVCTAVGSANYYLMSGDRTDCSGTCNSDNTACGEGGNVDPDPEDNDIFYDCSDVTDGGQTLSALCAADNASNTVALCVACDKKQYFCATPAQAQQAIGQSAAEITGKDVCGDSGATCDMYDCSSVAKYAEDCEGDGYTLTLCDASGYTCGNRKESLDGSCSDGSVGYSVWTNNGDVDACLVIGIDESCLGGGSGDIDDTFYDCSNISYNSSTIAKEICTDSSKPVALCVPCNETAVWCVSSATAQSVIGASATSMGADPECEGAGSDYEVCDADCSTMPGSTAICQGNYYQCSKPCTSVGSTSTLCDDMSGAGDWASYPVVCTAVGSANYYLMSDDPTDCSGTCNADNTACK